MIDGDMWGRNKVRVKQRIKQIIFAKYNNIASNMKHPIVNVASKLKRKKYIYV